MNKIFDYFFYRLTTLYFKWDKREGLTAILGISLSQTIFICDLIISILRIFYNKYEVGIIIKRFGLLIYLIGIPLIIKNYLRYKNLYFKCKARWKNENTTDKIINSLAATLFILLPWILSIIIGIYLF